MQTAVRPPARSHAASLAQQNSADTPPKLEVIEEGSDTPIVVTPPKTGGARISEKKDGGRTTEVKVRTGKSAYTMKGAHPSAVNERGNATGSTLGTPQWQVLEFDLARKKKTDKEAVLRPRTFRRRHRRPSWPNKQRHALPVPNPLSIRFHMAVFTAVSLDDVSHWLEQFPLGKALSIRGIASGIENSNFFITTEADEHVLTIFEVLKFDQLPFYLNLMRHLAERGVLVLRPRSPMTRASWWSPCTASRAAIVSKLDGSSQMDPQPVHCAAVGAMLARMHLAALDFPLRQPNLRGLDWWNATTPRVLPFLDSERAHLLRAEMHFQEAYASCDHYKRLGSGPVHADLFHNNVMFDGERLTGFFDFYFAYCDTWLFDVAVTVNDWCIDQDSGVLDAPRVRAMLDAYHAVRPFTADEQAAWQPMLRAAALRFWLSRLYDFHQPREAEMLTPHDPTHFERILRERIATPKHRSCSHEPSARKYRLGVAQAGLRRVPQAARPAHLAGVRQPACRAADAALAAGGRRDLHAAAAVHQHDHLRNLPSAGDRRTVVVPGIVLWFPKGKTRSPGTAGPGLPGHRLPGGTGAQARPG
ncbi:homoserine kinase [Massilia sp. B-10]|nr:homoserine kinase [Massilia sp. B-10]